jgi:Peptidase family M48
VHLVGPVRGRPHRRHGPGGAAGRLGRACSWPCSPSAPRWGSGARSGRGCAADREQVALLGLVGRADAGLGAVVLEDLRPAAYALPGRIGTVVVTTGAVHGLPPAQLAAVLTHERAHTTGRHRFFAQASSSCATRRSRR